MEKSARNDSAKNGRPIDESQFPAALIYLDNIVMFSCAPDEHINHVQVRLSLLHVGSLKLNLKNEDGL